MKKLINQLLKFGLVGGIAFLIDYGLLFICTEWFGIYYFISSIISFSVSVIFNYVASVLWVFDVDQEKSKTKNFIIFIALSIVGLGINQIIMWYGVEVLKLYYMLIKLIATFIVMVFNFITRKMFIKIVGSVTIKIRLPAIFISRILNLAIKIRMWKDEY